MGGESPKGSPSTTHPFSDGPIPYGQIIDCGWADYREFACSHQTFEMLVSGGMKTVDGMPVRLQKMDECVGGHNIFVKAWFQS